MGREEMWVLVYDIKSHITIKKLWGKDISVNGTYSGKLFI